MKKILALCLVVILAVTAVTGATLAYFTDTDTETNVFTTGDVDIDLEEVFPESEDDRRLLPGKDITKEVDVRNEGSEDAYVRVHIAFPSMLDSGSEDQPEFAAYNNTLHWNFSNASIADGKWNWNADKDGTNYPGNGGNWNMYQDTIDGILYNIYVATYETILTPNDGSEEFVEGSDLADNAIYKVYLDANVTNDMMEDIIETLGANPKVLVFAEGGQVEGFEGDPYGALNTQFGTPGSEGYKSPWNQTND